MAELKKHPVVANRINVNIHKIKIYIEIYRKDFKRLCAHELFQNF